jgi:hypothetical protein
VIRELQKSGIDVKMLSIVSKDYRFICSSFGKCVDRIQRRVWKIHELPMLNNPERFLPFAYIAIVAHAGVPKRTVVLVVRSITPHAICSFRR